jgi:uncharacterized protein YndB with AHSA1/START domain
VSGETLVIERTFQAPAGVVFDAWTNEEVMRHWFPLPRGRLEHLLRQHRRGAGGHRAVGGLPQ